MATRAHRLLAIEASDLPVVQYGGTTVRMAQFVAKAEQLASALPTAAYVINLAENRHHFLLGWVAATLREQVTLLPPGQTSDVLARLRREYSDHHTLDDAGIAGLIASGSRPITTLAASWEVPAERVVAIAFTSGSTGEPQAHPKTWGSLLENSRAAAREVLGGMKRSLVSTVPPQHMYGLEASTLAALAAQCFLFDRKPFFP